MRAVIQRVLSASVTIGGERTAAIEQGLEVLLGIEEGDTEKDAQYLCDKLLSMRIFDDDSGVPNRDVGEAGGAVLLISQFTLLGDARKGRRPSYIRAARPETAVPLYEWCKAYLAPRVPLQTGTFQADMQVALINDGPFTILLDSRKEF